MKHHYFWLFLGLLTWQLAACSTDQASERTAGRRPPTYKPAIADSLATPPISTGYDALASPAKPIVPATPKPTAERPATAGRQQAATYPVPSMARRNPARYPVPLARPTTLADATALEAKDEPASTAVVPEPAQPTGLNAFLASGLPAAQEFTVQPGHDTLLIGRQGTQLFVPADAWAVPPTGAPVHVQLREFYSTTDIVLASLSTTASGELLETGGMLNLTATSETGQPIALRSGTQLTLRMPTKQVKPEMQLFQGNAADAHINWHLDSSATRTFSFGLNEFRVRRKKRVHHKTLRDEWPEYLNNEHRQVRELLRASTYSAATVAKLRQARKLSAQERAAVVAYNYYVGHEQSGKLEKIRRLAEVEFTVDTTGATTNVRLRTGYDAALAAPILAHMQTWQGWRPAQLARSAINNYGLQYQQLKHKEQAVGVVRTMITLSGKILVTPPSWDVWATRAKQDLRAGLQKQASYRARVNAAKSQNDSTQRRGGQLPLRNPATPTEADLFYELTSSGLGWINCDRFLGAPQPLFAYEFKAQMPCDKAMLVFRDSRTMINGTWVAATERILFGKVPTGAEATIVAVRWQQGQAYLAVQPMTLVAQAAPQVLEYRPVNILELQTALANLN